MSQLNLQVCPICYETGSLVRQTKTVQGTAYLWYECQHCSSVLLWMGGDTWTYQKVGLPDKAHLLKQPLSAIELEKILAPPPPALDDAPAESIVRDAPAVPPPLPARASREGAEAPAGAGQAPAKRQPRLLGIGVVVVGLSLVIVAAALLLLAPPGDNPAPTPTALALATETVAPTNTALSPTETPPPRPTATWVPTLPPIPPPPTNTPDPELLASLDAVEFSVVEIRGLQETVPISRTLISRRDLAAHQAARFEREYPPGMIEQEGRVWAAFGLIPQPYNLADTLEALYRQQVLGLYDREAQTLYAVPDISGGSFDLFAQVVYAHEYALALQDQHTDLGALLDRKELDDDELLARQALVEGYATQLMAAYFSTLPASEDDVLKMTTRDLRGSQGMWYNLPEIILFTFPVPYSAGSYFIENLVEQGGWPAVDAAFLRPPQSTEQILHLERYLTPDEPTAVNLPPLGETLGASWHLVKANTLGELRLNILLFDGIGEERANAAADGWDGDQYALYADERAEVLVFKTAWDSDLDREEFVEAYTDYTEANEGLAPDKTGDPARWWKTEDRAILLTWRDARALIIIGPDAATIQEVLDVVW